MNPFAIGGVLSPEATSMYEIAARLLGNFLALDADLEREFETRMAQTSLLAFRVAYSVLRNREDAEDVAQSAFISAYRNFRLLRDRDKFGAWLVRITWRLAINRTRTDRRRAAREQAPLPPVRSATAEDVLASNERSAHVWRAVDELPVKLRTVIVLSSIEDLQVSSVAALLGVPEGTVKSRLFLARKRLAEKLQWIAKDSI